jgi:hypothetical protein
VSYTAPTITASGGTFAQLQALGLSGWLDLLATANSLTDAQRAELHRSALSNQIFLRAAGAVTNYTSGAPVATADIAAELLDLATVFSVVATALNEIGTLIDANPGTLTNKVIASSGMVVPTRTFP